MSASDEKMVDTAIARAKELTSHMIGDDRGPPPVSPQQEKSPFFEDDGPGLISKLKNSIRRSSSPKSERKRTFSEKMEEMEHKADMDTSPTPEAQQAYNVLVERGVTNSHSTSHHVSTNNNADISDTTVPEWRNFSKTSSHREPDQIKDSGLESSSKLSNITSTNSYGSGNTVTEPSNRPLISAPQLQIKSFGVSHPKPTSPPVPAPRPIKQDSFTKKSSELPVPRPRPEIQRVEPIIRHQVPESPELNTKTEKRIEINPPQQALRQDSKEHEREQLKRTIEIVRVEDNHYLNDDNVVSNSLDRSSELSSQRSSLDRSDNTSENAESERAEWETSSDGSKPDSRVNTSLTERADSFNKKQSSLANSLFEEDLEPSPQEIMSKLREKRLNRHLDHQRSLTDGESSRPQNARVPNIPGRTVDQDDGGDDEVDTNPLRMLRGGAIPIRTGRSVAGTGIHSNQVRLLKSLRVPPLLMSSNISRKAESRKKPTEQMAEKQCDSVQEEKTSLTQELEQLTNTLMEGNLNQVACVVTQGKGAQDELDKFQKLQALMQTSKHTKSPAHRSHRSPPPPPIEGNIPLSPSLADKSQSSDKVGTVDSVARDKRDVPPRLPPRRSQSMTEDPEKDVSIRALRRSSSFEDSEPPPTLPPRDPQKNSCRTALNAKPRERKHPLLVRPIDTNTQYPLNTLQEELILPPERPPLSKPWPPFIPLRAADPFSSNLTSQVQKPNSPSTMDPSANPIGFSVDLSSRPPSSVELPPTYDMSLVDDVANSEPTHMLLAHVTVQPVAVNLPPSNDLTGAPEPSRIALSPINHNKRSWLSPFSYQSSLSSSDQFQNESSFQLNQSNSKHCNESHSQSHDYGINYPQCPSPTESQSPPADLPPAPPTPSYRDKLGLDTPRGRVTRSVSYNLEASQMRGHQSILQEKGSTIPRSYHTRKRSASANSPAHLQLPLAYAEGKNSKSKTVPLQIFQFQSNNEEEEDDAFFAEAPSDPHPYSQSPFHPIVTSYNTTVQPTPTASVSNTSHSLVSSTSNLPPLISATSTYPSQPPQTPSRSTSHTVALSYTTLSPPPTSFHGSCSKVIVDTSKCNSDVTEHAKPKINYASIQSTSEHPPNGQSLRSTSLQAQVFRYPVNPPQSPPILIQPSSDCEARLASDSSGGERGTDYLSSSEVSPLMFASYHHPESVSYEDLMQFAVDR